MLQLILLGYIITWIVQLNSFSIYVILRQPDWCAYTGSILALAILIFAILVILLLLLKPDIYYKIKYKTNNLSEQTKSEYLNRLNKYMETEKPYLNPDISLELLARNISINPRLLSQLINETFKTNFKSYLNSFRIKECERIILIEQYKKYIIWLVLIQDQYSTICLKSKLDYPQKILRGRKGMFSVKITQLINLYNLTSVRRKKQVK